jgi:hypothetical protein
MSFMLASTDIIDTLFELAVLTSPRRAIMFKPH